MPSPTLSYDIVIVTRNRQDALPISIPKMMNQSRRPQKLIVVDSSDDHAETVRIVEEAFAGCEAAAGGVRLEIERFEVARRAITRQRNAGLLRCESDVVFFPDDDAIWFDGVAESIMRVYERDERGVIGGVCAAESPLPPPDLVDELASSYQMTFRDRVQQRFAIARNRVERRLLPDPFLLHGCSRWQQHSAPEWLAEENAVLVEWMTGFRMTFRTSVVRETGFEDAFAGYGGFEDVDGSWGVAATHLLVGARNASVFHYRAPNGRSDGFGMGMRQILNKAYVVCKHSEPGSEARRRLLAWCRYKVLLYVAGISSTYGRERLVGAWRGLRRVHALNESPRAELLGRYTELRAECLSGRGEV